MNVLLIQPPSCQPLLDRIHLFEPLALEYLGAGLQLDGHAPTILDARIVPPTSQNQARIERSLHGFVERHLALDDDELHLRCEQAVRSYDPCISCATHFLKLTVDRA